MTRFTRVLPVHQWFGPQWLPFLSLDPTVAAKRTYNHICRRVVPLCVHTHSMQYYIRQPLKRDNHD